MRGTIKSKREIEHLFKHAQRSSSSLISVLFMQHSKNDKNGRCAFIAGKKLGNAPLRNRCKRVMRSAAAELNAPWPFCDVVFIAHKSLRHSSHQKIVDDMKKQLRGFGISL